MFKQLVVTSAIALLSVSASAAVVSPSIAFSTGSYTSNTAIYPDYAGDSSGGSARLYDMFRLPAMVDGTKITSAMFSIDVTGRWSTASAPLGLYSVTDDPVWPRSWDMQPVLAALITSFNPSSTAATYVFDVTAFINSQYLGDGLATMAVAGLTEGLGQYSWSYFGSSQLELRIGTSDVPEPGTLALIGIALLGTGIMRGSRRTAAVTCD